MTRLGAGAGTLRAAGKADASRAAVLQQTPQVSQASRAVVETNTSLVTAITPSISPLPPRSLSRVACEQDG
jgi:hypothetical protein